LPVIFDAFDGAWNEPAPDVGSEPATVEAAQSELATILLGLATADPIERDRLKADAVLSYRLMHAYIERSLTVDTACTPRSGSWKASVGLPRRSSSSMRVASISARPEAAVAFVRGKRLHRACRRSS